MPYFKDADDVYAVIGKLFVDLTQDEELAPKFRKANSIVQFQYRNPASQITIKAIEGQEGVVDCGETSMTPDIVMSMDADTAHKYWLGKVNVTVALARVNGSHPEGDAEVAKKYMLAAREDGLPVDENGLWTGKEEILTVAANSPPDNKVAEAFQAAAQKLGFKLSLRLVPREVVYTNFCASPSKKVAI